MYKIFKYKNYQVFCNKFLTRHFYDATFRLNGGGYMYGHSPYTDYHILFNLIVIRKHHI